MTPDQLKKDADAKIEAAQKLLAEAAAEEKQAETQTPTSAAVSKPEPTVKTQPSVYETNMMVAKIMKGNK